MSFSLDEAIRVANVAYADKFERNLTDIEIVILKGSWERLEYDQIAAQNLYATSYISQDAAPKLWKNLGLALGEKVRKSNFRQALQRYWESQAKSSTPSRDATVRRSSGVIPTSIASVSTTEYLEPYVERPLLESLAIETLQEPGSLVRVKAPKFMGKTALAHRVLSVLEEQGDRTVLLSFELADRQTHLTQLNRFLRWFCLNIGRELGLPNALDEYWDEEGMGAKVSCTTYFEEYLLEEIEGSLVLCLDDLDLLFPHPEIYEDFFGLLRSWHEKARRRKSWQKLRLIIAHATEVYIRLNINQSPFNVGVPLELPEFTREQSLELAHQHGLTKSQNAVDALTGWVGGHPYLLEKAFQTLRQRPDLSLEQLLGNIATESGLYRNHLHEHWVSLQADASLLQALKQVVTADNAVELDPTTAYQLQSMGLIKMSGNQAAPRLKLYQQYFRDCLTSS